MRVAVVGSRKGAALDDVTKFLSVLHAQAPDTVMVSGGAAGVDKTAEQGWLARGGRVVSLRPNNVPTALGESEWWVERWMLGLDGGRVEPLRDVSFADFTSCAFYRDMMIAEYCDYLVAFQSDPPSPGTAITTGFAKSAGKEHYVYTPKTPFACV